MLFNMFIYFISLLVAIQGAKSQITIDPTSCASYMLNLRAALDEMVELSDAAYTRTYNTLNNPATPVNEMRIVQNTFRVYFGTTTPAQSQIIANQVLRESF